MGEHGAMEGKGRTAHTGKGDNSLQLQVRGGIWRYYGQGRKGGTCTGWWKEQVWKNLLCEIKECEFEMCCPKERSR